MTAYLRYAVLPSRGGWICMATTANGTRVRSYHRSHTLAIEYGESLVNPDPAIVKAMAQNESDPVGL